MLTGRGWEVGNAVVCFLHQSHLRGLPLWRKTPISSKSSTTTTLSLSIYSYTSLISLFCKLILSVVCHCVCAAAAGVSKAVATPPI